MVAGPTARAGQRTGDLDDLPDTSITQTEAIDRLDALAHEVIELLPSQARPVNRYGPDKAEVDNICIIGLAQKITGQVKVVVEYDVLDLPPQHFPEYGSSRCIWPAGRRRDPYG